MDASAAASAAAVREAVDRYHSLLASGDLAAETQGALADEQRRRGLTFGGKPLASVLRPRFTTAEAQHRLDGEMRPLLAAFATALHAALADDAVLAQFRLEPWEEELARLDPGIHSPSVTSRMDAFVIPETGAMRITEYNAETPAGAAFTDNLSDVFANLPVMREFAPLYEFVATPARPGVLRSILEAYREWSGARAAPRIAIVDWAEVPSAREFVLFRDYFESHGLSCVIVDPRHAEYVNGTLRFDDRPVDLVYKRVLITELVERGGLDHPIVRAVRDRAVCMVNGFRCKILHKKASLAVLSDERNARLFDGAQQAAIAAHVPWTRVVEERRTTYDGSEIDLVPFMVRERERLVIKPNDEYGGTGIVLGWKASDSEWDRAIRTALTEPHIVQERVPIPMEPYATMADGSLQFVDHMVDTAPFVCNGAYSEGTLNRLSASALLNVTAGGASSVPSFLVRRR